MFVCVYVGVYMYMCIHVHTCVWIYLYMCVGIYTTICVYARIYMHIYMCACVYMCVWVCVYVYLCPYVCKYIWIYVFMCVYIFVYMCIYICIYVYMYICVYICVYVCGDRPGSSSETTWKLWVAHTKPTTCLLSLLPWLHVDSLSNTHDPDHLPSSSINTSFAETLYTVGALPTE